MSVIARQLRLDRKTVRRFANADRLTIPLLKLKSGDDPALFTREVNELVAPRYIGQRLGSQRWEVIKNSDRVGIHMRIDRVHARGV